MWLGSEDWGGLAWSGRAGMHILTLCPSPIRAPSLNHISNNAARSHVNTNSFLLHPTWREVIERKRDNFERKHEMFI